MYRECSDLTVPHSPRPDHKLKAIVSRLKYAIPRLHSRAISSSHLVLIFLCNEHGDHSSGKIQKLGNVRDFARKSGIVVENLTSGKTAWLTSLMGLDHCLDASWQRDVALLKVHTVLYRSDFMRSFCKRNPHVTAAPVSLHAYRPTTWEVMTWTVNKTSAMFNLSVEWSPCMKHVFDARTYCDSDAVQNVLIWLVNQHLEHLNLLYLS